MSTNLSMYCNFSGLFDGQKTYTLNILKCGDRKVSDYDFAIAGLQLFTDIEIYKVLSDVKVSMPS